MSFDADTPFVVARVGDTRWQLTSSLTYRGKRDTITVPAGYVTDFASVPRFLQWLAPATGKYTLAAVLHDYLCDRLNRDGRALLLDYPHATYVTSRDVDGLFRRVMRELGVPVAQRWMMWCGVRWGAMFNGRRRPGIARDLPLVLLLSVLALPLVLPASVCIGVALLLQLVYNTVSSFVTGDGEIR